MVTGIHHLTTLSSDIIMLGKHGLQPVKNGQNKIEGCPVDNIADRNIEMAWEAT